MFKNPLFNRLKASNPEFLNKVEPITGDVTLPNLGIKPQDEQTLVDKVSVVFHAAATIKFNEPLPVAMNINFEGTQKILELSQRMKNIEAFVYISTAYAHTQRKILTETIYPEPAKLDDVYKFIEEYGDDTKETMKFITGKPNTYAFTKSLTEAYIAKHHGNMPTVIVRPSAITSTKDEPIKGWLDNWFGTTAILYNTAKGWNRFIVGDGSNIADMIPVDYVSNMSIVAAARVNKSNEIKVFNSTSSSENPISWSDAHKYFCEETVTRGKHNVPYPGVIYLKSRAVANFATIILQMTPAQFADLWLKLTGREPKYVKTISQLKAIREVTDFYTENSWVLRADRARELFVSMSPEDRQKFPCDPTQIEWSEYIRDYCKAVCKYLTPRH